MSAPLLSTKLFIPQITEKHVKRNGLQQKFIRDFCKDRHFTLVCAPAGYGKTTLTLEMLGELKCSSAWITLDEGDNDVNRFLTYLINALKKSGISVGDNVAYLVSDLNFNSINIMLTEILNSIAEFSEKVILVLDDYHLIKEKQIDDIIKFILENQPPNLHMVMTSRQDPSFPLSRLRVNGRITEIRMQDLCFSKDEANEFYRKTLDRNIDYNLASRITATTEGWIAGMQLVGLLLKDLNDVQAEEAINKFNGTHSYIIDYLVEEVLQRQPEDIKEFLCKTSVLERMNRELCDELTGMGNSSEILIKLEKANLFLIPLDSTREWYRYHQLFADSLRIKLSDEDEKDLCKKAALWMMKKDFCYEAVNYAFKSGDMQLALRMVEDTTKQAFQDAQLSSFVMWLDKLPGDMVRKSEVVSVRKSIALFATGKVKEAVEHLHSLGEDFIKSASSHNKGLVFSLKALVESYVGRDAEAYAMEALNLLEPWDPIARTSMMNILGKSHYLKGRIGAAVETYEKAFKAGMEMGYTLITTLVLMNYGDCLNVVGKRNEAFELFTNYIDGMSKKFGKPLPFIGIIYVAISALYYEKNKIALAKNYLEQGIELCKSISYVWLVSGINHANIKFASGEKEEAIKILKSLLSEDQSANIQINVSAVLTVLIQHLLKTGNVAAAESYGNRLEGFVQKRDELSGQIAAIGFARLLIYRGFPVEAEKLLLASAEMEKFYGRQKNLITVFILLSAAYCKKNDPAGASKFLGKAVALALPGGYVRLFLDEEPLVKDLLMLPDIIKDARQLEWVENLKRSLGFSANKKAELDFGEKLSERELEILNLIASGKSNTEIAKALYISINTTQWHISNLYSKLQVKSRTQAILKAKELELV